MNKRAKITEPLCATSEKENNVISVDEISQIKIDVGKRIVEAFNYHPDAEIAFLLKSSCRNIRAFTEGEEFPPVDILLSIHKLTGVSIHWLLTGEGTKRPIPEMPLIITEESSLLGLA